MAFTMHSHSGQFCSHAVDQLEEVVQQALALGFRTIGLSEHMPRFRVEDLYPEERKGNAEEALAGLQTRYDAYVREAVRLRDAYADRIAILIGFETEWIRGRDHDGPHVQALAARPHTDYFVGSVHHVRGVPLDYDKAMYAQATALCVAAGRSGGASEQTTTDPELFLYLDYYDEQYDMLQTLQPRVVGHFDLVRLLSVDPGRDCLSWDGSGSGSGEEDSNAKLSSPLASKIMRNLQTIQAYGGWLECNTAALRKGLAEPYPARPIAEAWLRLGGRFTLSDDSHGVAHVGTHYRQGLAYLESLGVTEVWTLARTGGDGPLVETSVSLSEVAASLKLPA